MKFQCPYCSQRLSVRDNVAHRRVACPKCKRTLKIPPPVSSAEALENAEDQKPVDPTLSNREILESLKMDKAPEHSGQRDLPWAVDILLYPFSGSGVVFLLVTMAIIFGMILGQRLIPALARPGRLFPLPLAFLLYIIWYLADCIDDSAQGGIRAPNAFARDLDFKEAGSRVVYLIAAGVVTLLPAILYAMFTHRIDWIFGALAAWAVVFFPMGLLAMAVMDSSDAVNPFYLLLYILRVFLPYCGLLIVELLVIGFVIFLVWVADLPNASSWGIAIFIMFLIYGALVMGHLLGRFFWRYKDRLDW
ncbi:hypothetical protein ACFL6U_18855 [Planctomycetota bacterium]